jgi:hypothetical protein
VEVLPAFFQAPFSGLTCRGNGYNLQPVLTGVRQDLYLSLGKWTKESLHDLIVHGATIADTSRRILFISSCFLGLPYSNATLIGSPQTEELLVLNLERVDCFTFIDYVEAMRLSSSFDDVIRYLREIRYKEGHVCYAARNHFFSDWLPVSHVQDMTAEIGGKWTQRATKSLNLRENGAVFLPGIPPVSRTITFVPKTAPWPLLRQGLRMGDYVGIYTETEGLDVSHVGIIVLHNGGLILRHASSLAGKVVDQNLETYMEGKAGIIVYRPVP